MVVGMQQEYNIYMHILSEGMDKMLKSVNSHFPLTNIYEHIEILYRN